MVSTRSGKRHSRSPVSATPEARSVKQRRDVVRRAEDVSTLPKPGNDDIASRTAKQKPKDVKLVLLDIEGTICPITFVKDTLFPYALKALPDILKTKWDDPSFIEYRDAFPETARSSPEAFEAHVKDLSERDVKIAYLKNLQGYLWEEGYKNHVYSTPIYPDVLAAFDSWSSASASTSRKEIAIYSSGSIFAQKLLFQHIKDPAIPDDPEAVLDRRGIIKDWFDTTNAGLKHETGSYEKIAVALGQDPLNVLFLSDSVKEVRAALGASMKAVVVDRPGNPPLSEEDRQDLDIIESLEHLEL